MQQLRREAYGEDIGQHSWVTADELRADVARLALTSNSSLVDLGCGPGGPLSFIAARVRCRATGLEINEAALGAARARAQKLGLNDLVSFDHADLNVPLPIATGSFDAAIALDVILHVRDRAAFIHDVARILRPGGRFLFTDAGVVTGAISNEEVQSRSVHGTNHFVPPGVNEKIIAAADLQLVESENRTRTLVASASGRLAALLAHRAEFEKLMSADSLASQLTYLETVVELARRGALSRMMYLAAKP